MAQTYKLARSPVHQLFDGEAIIAADVVSTNTILPQRMADENGAWQVELNQDPTPGGAPVGNIVLEGRLDQGAGWAEVDSIPLTDFVTDQEVISSNVRIMPEMRIATRGAGYSVLAGTTMKAWVME